MNARRILLFTAGFAAPLAAQTNYFVDGAFGIDGPGRGTTATTPWRTITYAVANAAASAANPATVRIQGGQTYAATSNGESFPVTLPPHIGLLGLAANGSLPVLALPNGATGLRLDPFANHPSPALVHRNLVVQGGAIGFDVGADVGVAHFVAIETCEFRGQSASGVRSAARGGSNDLAVRRCVLQGASNGAVGVLQSAVSTPLAGPLQRLRVQGCTLRDWGAGVGSDSIQLAQWTFDIVVEDSTISACSTGLALASPAGFAASTLPKSTTIRVDRTRITDCVTGIAGVDAPSFAPHTMTATDVAVVRCTTGASLRAVGAGQNSSSSYTTTWNRALFANCAKGVDVFMSNNGTMSTQFQATDFLGNLDNVVGATQFGNYAIGLDGCRLLDGGSGVHVAGGGQSWVATLTVNDSLIGRLSGTGIRCSDGVLTVDSCTIADTATGVVNNTTRGNVTACLFSGNGTDVQVNNPPAYPWPFVSGACATDSATAVPGGNNLQFASVGLQRPSLKLARNSLCIDRIGAGGTDYEGDPRGVAATPAATAFGDIGADEYMPAGSLRPYGLPTYGAVAASPTIGSPSTTAPIGGSYTVQLTNGAPASATSPSLAVLVTSLVDVAAPLPTELGVIGLAGCLLWLEPLVLQTLPPVGPSGSLSTSIAIPNQTALRGFVLTHQWLVGLPQPQGFVTSNALRVTVGQ